MVPFQRRDLDIAPAWEPVAGFGRAAEPGESASRVLVILQGSAGLNIRHDNEEFLVEGTFHSPELTRLAYRGHPVRREDGAGVEIWAVDSIVPLDGENRPGEYDLATGGVTQVA